MRMSKYTRTRRRAASGGDKNSFWLSFSDLMSALVLVIILVLFYMLYQYFLMYDDYEERRDQMVLLQASLAQSEQDIAQQEAALAAAQTELDEKSAALATAQDELAASQDELTAAQDELAASQVELTAAQEDLAVQQLLLAAAQEAAQKTQEELDAQEAELAATLETLDSQQQQLSQQHSQIADQQQQLAQQQQQIEELVGIRTQIISDLSSALREANISATVDPTSGAIALASDVLFDTGRSDLSDEGCARIDQFLPVYLDVLFSDEYRSYVSEIIIEGHTDSVGSYIDNLLLSQQRAYSVASYVLADGYAQIDEATREHLRDVTTANGRSESDLIYGADGAEDRSASRRVVFKFRLTDEQMVTQLQAILEQSDASAQTDAAQTDAAQAGTSQAEAAQAPTATAAPPVPTT